MKEKKNIDQMVEDLAEVRNDLTKNIARMRRLVKKGKILEAGEALEAFKNENNIGLKISARVFACNLLLKIWHFKILGKNASQATTDSFEVFLGELKKGRKGIGAKISETFGSLKKKIKDTAKKW